MDPLSITASTIAIVGAATATFNVIKQLNDFLSDVSRVDDTVNKFLTEVREMHNSLETINDSFSQIKPFVQGKEHVRRLWASVESTGQDCIRTSQELHALFQSLQKSTRNVYQALVKQLQLNSKGGRIAELRRQISLYNSAFQTQIVSITLCIVSQDRPPLSVQHIGMVTEVVLSQLEDRLDAHHFNLGQLRSSRQAQNGDSDDVENDSDQIIRGLEECSEAAHDVYAAASNAMGRLSTTRLDKDMPLTTAQRKRVYEWVQERSVTGSVAGDLDFDAIEADFFYSISQSDEASAILNHVEDQKSMPQMSSTSTVHDGIRSDLINRALMTYTKGLYQEANGCFREARNMAQCNQPYASGSSLFSKNMSEETLMLWLALTESRLMPRSQQSHHRANDNLVKIAQDTGIDLVALSRPHSGQFDTAQSCLNACLLAQIILHSGAIDRAERICDLAVKGLLQIKGSNSAEYQEALTVLVEVLYSKGPTPIAQRWCSEVSWPALHERIQPFLTMKNYDNKQELPINRMYKRAALEDAVAHGNFYAVLYILSTVKDTDLKFIYSRFDLKPSEGINDDYLVMAIFSNSLAVMSLLLQHRSALEDYKDRLEFDSFTTIPACDRMFYKKTNKPTYEAIRNNWPAAVDLLLRFGINVNAELAYMGNCMHAKTCYQEKVPVLLSPLAYAISEGRQEICEILLEKGAEVNGTSDDCEPPLNLAIRCLKGRYLIPWLLDKGADVDFKFRGVRPLALAIYHSGKPPESRRSSSSSDVNLVSRKTAVEWLIGKGVNVNKSSLIGYEPVTPLQQAENEHEFDIADLLFRAGAYDSRARDSRASDSRTRDPRARDSRAREKPKKMFGIW